MTNKKLSFEEQLAKYELAIGLIDEMVGLRSSWISEEYRKEDKSELSILTWREEQRALAKERSDLDPEDLTQIHSIVEKYSPMLKAIYKNNKKEK